MILDAHTRYAGFWRRLGAFLIDVLLINLLLAPVLFFLGKAMPMQAMPSLRIMMLPDWLNWLLNILLFVIVVFLWVRFQGTPGKLLLGCRLVDAASGQSLSVRQAVLRNIAYLVSLLTLGLGFLWIGWDKRKQGFHDKIAKTVVVIEDPAHMSLAELEKELR